MTNADDRKAEQRIFDQIAADTYREELHRLRASDRVIYRCYIVIASSGAFVAGWYLSRWWWGCPR